MVPAIGGATVDDVTSTWTVIVAAGSGSRFGGPKQFELLGDRRVIDWSVGAAREVCDGVVVVVDEGHAGIDVGADAVVVGGSSRSASVRNGLAALPDGCDVVVIHDAARPGATPALFRRVIAAVRGGATAAVPGVAMVDTVKEVGPVDDAGDRSVVATLDRSSLVSVQTPQAFRRRALEAAHAMGGDATDDAALIEQDGGTVLVVNGEPSAHKITSQVDLAVVAVVMGLGR